MIASRPITLPANAKFSFFLMYVLCSWKGRLWPAKVLSRSWTLPKYKRRRVLSLQVQILSEDQKLRVKGKDARALNKLEIEALATSARNPFSCHSLRLTTFCLVTS
uniref:PWWP domain-containing protein n=1 Tax=Marmota marmota marmota TaxID=9994 RepID=A0A8C6EST1_MARMA